MNTIKINIVELATKLAVAKLYEYAGALSESDYNFEFPNGVVEDDESENDEMIVFTEEAQEVFDNYYDEVYDIILSTRVDKEEIDVEEKLNQWYVLLSLEILEKIHGVTLYGHSPERIDELLDMVRNEWEHELTTEAKKGYFMDYYDKSLFFVGSDFEELFDDLYSSEKHL